ncbi:MAG: hypothetical protein CJBNEKGG_02567 [Prosthecobacter sp.]|nr:hypothetical protein [Prosthecobacter sp.]
MPAGPLQSAVPGGKKLQIPHSQEILIHMISATGQPLTREQVLQIRLDSSRGLSSKQIGEGIAQNRLSRLSKETAEPLPMNTELPTSGPDSKLSE